MLGTIHGAPARPIGTRTGPVVVYGNRWCGITMMVRRYLDRAGVPYQFVDLETHPEVRHQLEWVTGGYVASPTVYVGGEVLVQPSISELEWALSRSGIR
ncbi:glutaredoxin family protein [Roseomonas chloroacetimidivorans]|uniref:glutaredoxin family protein n=1 Tax=Roseomonas chloroacetimidivorans TaxID=1766656 RepID=UPI003C74E6E0